MALILIIIISVFFLLLICVFACLFFILASTAMIIYTGVPYAPTPYKAIEKIIKKLNIQPGQKVYDLGSGDGRFLFAAEKAGAQVIGFEISPAPYFKSQIIKITNGSKARLNLKNFFKADLSGADIVFCFLIDKIMPLVEKKLKAELSPGARVVSYGSYFPNWRIYDTILPDPEKEKTIGKIFIYIK